MNKKKFYITTPIYYPNAKPHLGTLYSTLLADVAARWHKFLGEDVFFITGTDEHGQKIQEKAESLNLDPKVFIDSIIPAYKEMWNLYEIEYNKFIRTTDPEHKQGVIHWIKKLITQGDIYKAAYTGWYCVPCETFVNIGSEPLTDDKGLYLCPTCNRNLRELSEESYFFRLSAYQDKLLNFYEEHPDFVEPKERLAEVISFVKSGLKDLSLSRKSVSWGIPFPGDPSHTVYVWADALNNYLTAVGYGQQTPEAQQEFAKWWPADLQVMAKDILRFHAIYWPAFLMAADLALPKKLLVHGYILMGDQKMSKSLGNAMDPQQLADWYGIEPVRYYLLRQMPITQDGHFELKDLEERISGDLANTLGNLLSRMQALALSNNLAKIIPLEMLEASSAALKEKSEEAFKIYFEEMNKNHFHIALAQLWRFISEVNAYFQAQKPWVLAKQDQEMFAEVISSTCHSLYMIGLMLWPIMPKKMEELLASLGHTITIGAHDYQQELRKNKWDKTFDLVKLDHPLFIRPETKIISQEQETLAPASKQEAPQETQQEISIEEFAKLELAIGTILTCVPVEGSSKLLKLEVDLGHLGQRQILSGIAQSFTPEDLIGKQGLYVTNLKPRKMMGMLSHGMMLFAKNGKGTLNLVTVDKVVESGSKVA